LKHNNKIHVPVVDPTTGEYMLLIKNKKVAKNINNQRFIKFYFPLINILHLLSGSDFIIIQYICHNLKINKDKVLILQNEVNLKKSAFYSAIKSLSDKNIIEKTKYQNIYKINKQFLYNGKY